MITGQNLRKLTYKKIRTVRKLIIDSEWEAAAYFMGYILECALKAASCKSLRLASYPPVRSKGEEGYGFKTHEFEQLLIVSGLNDLFGTVSNNPGYDNWSAFTIMYPGNWTKMRYEEKLGKFNEQGNCVLADHLDKKKENLV